MWIGKGNWVESYEEQKRKKQAKEKKFWDKVEEDRKKYLNHSNMKSFLTDKEIEEYFPVPDKTVKIKRGLMKQYDYKKVLGVLRRRKIQIKLKSSFENIHIEEFKEALRTHNQSLLKKKLEKKLPEKNTNEKPKKI